MCFRDQDRCLFHGSRCESYRDGRMNSSVLLWNRTFVIKTGVFKMTGAVWVRRAPVRNRKHRPDQLLRNSYVIKNMDLCSSAYQLSVQRWFYCACARTAVRTYYLDSTSHRLPHHSFIRSPLSRVHSGFLLLSPLSSFDSWSYQLVCWSTQGQRLIVTLPAVDAAPSYSPACSPSLDMRPAPSSSSWRSHTSQTSHQCSTTSQSSSTWAPTTTPRSARAPSGWAPVLVFES